MNSRHAPPRAVPLQRTGVLPAGALRAGALRAGVRLTGVLLVGALRAGVLLVGALRAGVLLVALVAGCRAGTPADPATAGAPAAGTSSTGASSTGAAGASTAARAALPLGSSSQTITAGGRGRTFRVYRPASLPAAAPLVVMLHGGFGSAEQAEGAYGWDAEADRGQFVVAYPDGVNRAWNVGGGCCGVPGSSGVDDVAFIGAVVADISARLPIDPRRIYATGISNGGMMSYRLACESSTFAAIGPDSATLLGDCTPPAPVSVIHIHGTADANIPYNGDPGKGVAGIDGPDVPSVIARWRTVDQCVAPAVSTAGTVTTSSATCAEGREVRLLTIAGAGHQWPGAKPKPLLQRLLGSDEPSDALDATATIWQFFTSHPKPTGT